LSTGCSGGGQAGGIKVALVAGSGSRPTGEIQSLLRKRLLFVALVSFLDYALSFVHLFFQSIAVWPFAVMLALTGGLALLLWSRRSLSLRALRGIEIILFGRMTLFLGFAMEGHLVRQFLLQSTLFSCKPGGNLTIAKLS
jgi:hypothetical protein